MYILYRDVYNILMTTLIGNNIRLYVKGNRQNEHICYRGYMLAPNMNISATGGHISAPNMNVSATEDIC